VIRTNVFLPEAMLARLAKMKARTGVPVAEFIRRAIEAALKKEKL
jgi:predicted DNA-binding protein